MFVTKTPNTGRKWCLCNERNSCTKNWSNSQPIAK